MPGSAEFKTMCGMTAHLRRDDHAQHAPSAPGKPRSINPGTPSRQTAKGLCGADDLKSRVRPTTCAIERFCIPIHRYLVPRTHGFAAVTLRYDWPARTPAVTRSASWRTAWHPAPGRCTVSVAAQPAGDAWHGHER